MGLCISTLGSKQRTTLHFIGLDKQGKKKSVYKIAEIPPNFEENGFKSCHNFKKDNLNINILGITGNVNINKISRKYLEKSDAFVYILHTCEIWSIIEAKTVLKNLSSLKNVNHKPILIFTKNHLKSSFSKMEIKEILNLNDTKMTNNCFCKVVVTNNMESNLLSQGIAWLLEMIEKKAFETNKNIYNKKKKNKHLIEEEKSNKDTKPNIKVEEKLSSLSSKVEGSKDKKRYKEKIDAIKSQSSCNKVFKDHEFIGGRQIEMKKVRRKNQIVPMLQNENTKTKCLPISLESDITNKII